MKFPYYSNDIRYSGKCLPVIFEPNVEAKEIIVNFFDQDGDVIYEPIVKTNDGSAYWNEVYLPSIPEKEGYGSDGYWVDEDGNFYYQDTWVMFDNRITNLTARYGESSYPPVNACVIFDPATYSGETEIIDGELYAKVVVDGYNSVILLNQEIDCTNFTTFKAKFAIKEYNPDYQIMIGIKDSSYNDVSEFTNYDVDVIPSIYEAGFAEEKGWNTISETKIAYLIQPFVQEKTNYSALSDVTIYIGKIWAE